MGCFGMFKSKSKVDRVVEEALTHQNPADPPKIGNDGDVIAQPSGHAQTPRSRRLNIWWSKVTAWFSSRSQRFRFPAPMWWRRRRFPAIDDEDIPTFVDFPSNEVYPNLEGYIEEVVTEMLFAKLKIPLASSPSIESLESILSFPACKDQDLDTVSVVTSVWDSDSEDEDLD